MKCRVKWLDHMSFVGESNSGHSVVMDGAPDAGGRNLGIRPMEMLLLGTGGCTSFDVISILKKQRQDVVDCVADMEAERATEIPQVFTPIHIHFTVSGRNLDHGKVKKAIELSANKYCSASKMMEQTAEVTHDFEIVEV